MIPLSLMPSKKTTIKKTLKRLCVAALLFLSLLIFWPPDMMRLMLPPSYYGFHSKSFERGTIYYKNDYLLNQLSEINQLVGSSEKSHGTKLQKPLKIYLFESHQQFKKFSRLNKPVMGTGLLGRRIWISPKIKTFSKETIEAYVSHELSHVLLYQNMSFLRGLLYPSWLIEGIATYHGQFGMGEYPSHKEVQRMLSEGYFVNPSTYRKRFGVKDKNRSTWPKKSPHPFAYSQFASMIQVLIERHGQSAFQSFLKQSLVRYDIDTLFEDIYGEPFSEFVDRYRAEASNND